MKILSKKQEIEHFNELKILQDENKELREKYKEQTIFYERLFKDIYTDLEQLNGCLKQNIGKDKIKIKVLDILIKLGGRQWRK